MRFEPKTDKEIAEMNLLPKGEYDYSVASAIDKTSKSGNEMIEVKLHVFHGEGFRIVTDYLMEAMPGKLRNFCVQNGLTREYDSGTLTAADCVGKAGKVLLKIEVDKSGQYPDRNSVVGYPLPKDGAPAQRSPLPPAPAGGFTISDDDVPF